MGTRQQARPALLVALLGLVACSNPPREPCALATPLGALCGFENPEDLEPLPGAHVILVSNMREASRLPRGGFLAAFAPDGGAARRVWPTGGPRDVAPDPSLGDPACPGPPTAEGFAPHGITSSGGRVYVVVHAGPWGGREGVEVFDAAGDGDGLVLSWTACIPGEANVMANDVIVAPDGEVVISNYEPDDSLWTTVQAHVLGRPVGDVMAWRRGQGWRHLAGTAARQTNGVAVSADGKWLFYAEIATGLVHRIARNGGGAPAAIEVGGNPDNLTWTSRGTLLVASHTGGARFLRCKWGGTPCRTPWTVHEIDPVTMTARLRFRHDGSVVGAVATALEVGDRTFLGSVFDDRIGVLATP